MFGEAVAGKIFRTVRAMALELCGFLARPLYVCTAPRGSEGEMCMSVASMSQLIRHAEGRLLYRCTKCAPGVKFDHFATAFTEHFPIVHAAKHYFGMRVVAYDPYLSASKAKNMRVELCETVDEAVERADFITLHMPKTPETTHLINAERISKMKPGVRIINCARGGLIDEAALLDAIKDGKVAAPCTLEEAEQIAKRVGLPVPTPVVAPESTGG